MKEINESIKDLNNIFLCISKQGWIRTKRKGNSGIGYTFEKLINKPEENFPIPDYYGIEIKTGRKNARRDIHLFSSAPDGDYLFQNERILKCLGYPDKDISNVKIFNMSFNSKNYKKIGLFKEGKIIVNEEKQKIEFVARKIGGKNFDINTSWSFSLLENRLNLKLQYLARIISDVKYINGIEYFKYEKITFYKLKDFNTFIQLIKDGYITIKFNIGVFKSGPKAGKTHDRGVGFSINEKYINLLFEKIDIVD